MPTIGTAKAQSSFIKLGTIRKGAPKTSNRPGKDLTYFRAVFKEGPDKDILSQEWHTLFVSNGEGGPTYLPVVLPFNVNRIPAPALPEREMWDFERYFFAWNTAYVTGGMVAQAGWWADLPHLEEYFYYLRDPYQEEILVKGGWLTPEGLAYMSSFEDLKRLVYFDEMKRARLQYQPEVTYVYYRGAKNKKLPVKLGSEVRLDVIVPALSRPGFMQFKSTSLIDMNNLASQLQGIGDFVEGKTWGLQCVLQRRPEQVATPIDGKRVRTEKWMVHIALDPRWQARNMGQITAGADLPQIPAVVEGEFTDLSPPPPVQKEVVSVVEHASEPAPPPAADLPAETEDEGSDIKALREMFTDDPSTAYWTGINALYDEQEAQHEGMELLEAHGGRFIGAFGVVLRKLQEQG